MLNLFYPESRELCAFGQALPESRMNEIPYPCLVALLGLALLAAGFALSAYRSRHGLGARLARRRLRARLLAVQSIDHPIDRAEVQP